MFGYLTADRALLTPEEDARYRACYCGLCLTLRKRWGTLTGLTLNYDQCFLILLLQSLYEAKEQNGEETCLMHPKRPHIWWRSRYTEYAADMNVALSYLKLLDDWEDDGNVASRVAASGFRRAYGQISELYPRQCGAMEQSIRALHEIEARKGEDPDAAAETFAMMMAEVFVFTDDRWKDSLRGLGAALGRFLYIMDACMDLDGDTLRNRYNPFRRVYGLKNNAERFTDILQMLLGECLVYFDRLPLVTDVGILKNILCFGLWAQFNKKYEIVKDDRHGIGSV